MGFFKKGNDESSERKPFFKRREESNSSSQSSSSSSSRTERQESEPKVEKKNWIFGGAGGNKCNTVNGGIGFASIRYEEEGESRTQITTRTETRRQSESSGGKQVVERETAQSRVTGDVRSSCPPEGPRTIRTGAGTITLDTSKERDVLFPKLNERMNARAEERAAEAAEAQQRAAVRVTQQTQSSSSTYTHSSSTAGSEEIGERKGFRFRGIFATATVGDAAVGGVIGKGSYNHELQSDGTLKTHSRQASLNAGVSTSGLFAGGGFIRQMFHKDGEGRGLGNKEIEVSGGFGGTGPFVAVDARARGATRAEEREKQGGKREIALYKNHGIAGGGGFAGALFGWIGGEASRGKAVALHYEDGELSVAHKERGFLAGIGFLGQAVPVLGFTADGENGMKRKDSKVTGSYTDTSYGLKDVRLAFTKGSLERMEADHGPIGNDSVKVTVRSDGLSSGRRPGFSLSEHFSGTSSINGNKDDIRLELDVPKPRPIFVPCKSDKPKTPTPEPTPPTPTPPTPTPTPPTPIPPPPVVPPSVVPPTPLVPPSAPPAAPSVTASVNPEAAPKNLQELIKQYNEGKGQLSQDGVRPAELVNNQSPSRDGSREV